MSLIPLQIWVLPPADHPLNPPLSPLQPPTWPVLIADDNRWPSEPAAWPPLLANDTWRTLEAAATHWWWHADLWNMPLLTDYKRRPPESASQLPLVADDIRWPPEHATRLLLLTDDTCWPLELAARLLILTTDTHQSPEQIQICHQTKQKSGLCLNSRIVKISYENRRIPKPKADPL